MRIKGVSYTGNGVDGRSVTGVGFRPDVVIIKRESGMSGGGAYMATSTMPVDKSKSLARVDAPEANHIQSLEADGFTIGSDNAVNASGAIFHVLCLQAHPADLVLGTYTGNGSDNRSITGVGFQPDVVIVLTSTDPQYASVRFSDEGSLESRHFGAIADAFNEIQELQADGFQVGNSSRVNKSGHTYHYIAWKNVSGFTETNHYEGNGSDNRSITGAGFQPDHAWIVNDETHVTRWHPQTLGVSTDKTLTFQTDGVSANVIQKLTADGIEVGNNVGSNASNISYMAVFFKEGNTALSEGGGGATRRSLLVF